MRGPREIGPCCRCGKMIDWCDEFCAKCDREMEAEEEEDLFDDRFAVFEGEDHEDRD